MRCIFWYLYLYMFSARAHSLGDSVVAALEMHRLRMLDGRLAKYSVRLERLCALAYAVSVRVLVRKAAVNTHEHTLHETEFY